MSMAAMTQEYAVKQQGKFEDNYWKNLLSQKEKKNLPLVPFTGIL